MFWRSSVQPSMENLCQGPLNHFCWFVEAKPLTEGSFQPNLLDAVQTDSAVFAHLVWWIWAVNKILYGVG